MNHLEIAKDALTSAPYSADSALIAMAHIAMHYALQDQQREESLQRDINAQFGVAP